MLRLQNALDAIDTDMAARLTQAAAQALIDTAVSDLLAGAPQALDTLNELAAALGDDAAFSTTVTTALAARLQLAGGTMTGDLTRQVIRLLRFTQRRSSTPTQRSAALRKPPAPPSLVT